MTIPAPPRRQDDYRARTRRLKWSRDLGHERLALVDPHTGLGDRTVVIADEGEHPGLQVLDRGEEAASRRHADRRVQLEPNLSSQDEWLGTPWKTNG